MPNLGETFRITATITDIDGNPVTAGANTINLYEPDATLHTSEAAPTHVGGGVWTQTFTTLTTDPEGMWLVVWTNVFLLATSIAKLQTYIEDPPVM